MNDLKKIGNRGILQRLADALKIEGVSQRSPVHLDTSRLVPVVALDPGMADYQQIQLSASIDITALPSWTWQPFGPANVSTGLLNDATKTDTSNLEVTILGMHIVTNYTPGGRDIDAPDTALNLVFSRQMAGLTASSTPESAVLSYAKVNTIDQQYYWSHPWCHTKRFHGWDPMLLTHGIEMAMNPVWVPAGSRYIVQGSRNGTVASWPIGTTLYVSCHAVACPKGMGPIGI